MTVSAIFFAGCEKRIFTAVPEPDRLRIFVSPTGSDGNDGTFEAPFASLERARDEVRQKKNEGLMPPGGAVVQLQDGIYLRTKSFQLDQRDGGSVEAPIIYQASEGGHVRIRGGVRFRLSQCLPVSDPEIVGRIPEEVRNSVRQIDLATLGASLFDPPPLFGHGMGMIEKATAYRSGPNASELFFDDEPMTLARWPNEGYGTIQAVVEKGDVIRGWMNDAKGVQAMEHAYVPPEKRNNPPKGFAFAVETDRLAHWKTAQDMMMLGYWYYNWSDQSVQCASIDPESGVIRSVQPSAYGIKSGQRFYVYNLLEELDRPGEWYLDRSTGMLYLYPPAQDLEAPIEFSVLKEPMVLTEGTSHVRFEGLDFGVARGSAFRIKNGSGVEISGCEIGNTGGSGVSIEGGRDHAVRNSRIFNTGAGGVSVTGGTVATLAPGGHVVENNLIYNFARIEKTYRPAVSLSGVGLRVAHNEIHHAPHSAIIFGGNNHVIEYNHIYDVCRESDDAAAIYAGRSWTARGTVIRNNLIRDVSGFKNGTHRVSGVYLDDGLSGTTVSDNIFLNVAQGLFFNGGRDNKAENNLFMNNANMMRGTDMSKAFTTWAAMSWKTLNGGLSQSYLKSEIWKNSYPTLSVLLEDEPQFPKNNIVRNNLCYQTPLLTGNVGSNFARSGVVDGNQKGIEEKFIQFGVVENNLEIEAMPGEYEPSEKRFRFIESSGVFRVMPGLKEIPVERIGREVAIQPVSKPAQ